ncbi:MAG: lysophospholipid acyltransferase family protein [Gaiellaceae bacterium]
MTVPDLVWGAGRLTMAPATRFFTRLQDYGVDRIPLHGGAVLAINHFHWIDVAAFGASCPRTIWYMAKIEAHRAPALGQLIRAFGSFAVRRGESDREAVRMAREIVRRGRVLGLFVEGTRQQAGVPGKAQPGAAMVALQEGVPVVPGAVFGSSDWQPGNFQPVSIAWGEPVLFEGLLRGARGYREASDEIERRIRTLWQFLGELHELGRPRVATPPV